MKNSFLFIIAVSAVLAASCSKEATTTQQITSKESQIDNATTDQTAANDYKIDSGSQAQSSIFRNSRKRLPSR